VAETLNDSGDGAVFGGLAAKDAVIGLLVRVVRQVDATSREDDSRGEQDSEAKQIAENDFDAVIVPDWGSSLGMLLGGGHQIFPQSPL
jgi:hypothetical protein